jgi:DNA-binding MarR family transcriptional regulator
MFSKFSRRARELSLTAKGNNIRVALLPIVNELQREILSPLNETDQDLFVCLARKIVLSTVSVA